MASSRNKPIWIVLLIASALLSLYWFTARAQTSDAEQIKEGAILFSENCAVCHGEQGQGRVGATLAKDWPSLQPSMLVKSTIENGIPGSVMPAWKGTLSDAQIDTIITYILSWQSGENIPLPTPKPATPRAPITPVPGVVGDPNMGVVLFDENCTLCHGSNGEGRIAPALNIDWASNRPDLLIKQTIGEGIKGSVMPAWSQANGGPLSEENINDIVAYILSWPGAQAAQATPTPQAQILSTGQQLLAAGICLVTVAAVIVVILLVQLRRKKEE